MVTKNSTHNRRKTRQKPSKNHHHKGKGRSNKRKPPRKRSLFYLNHSRSSVFYMSPKIHKANNPGRPIISAVSYPSSKIATFLDAILTPLVQQLPTFKMDASFHYRTPIPLYNGCKVPAHSDCKRWWSNCAERLPWATVFSKSSYLPTPTTCWARTYYEWVLLQRSVLCTSWWCGNKK